MFYHTMTALLERPARQLRVVKAGGKVGATAISPRIWRGFIPRAGRFWFCLNIALALTSLAFALETPDWVKNYGKSARYPDAMYLTGFGMDKLGKDKDRAKSMQRATESAKGNLIQRVRVSIQSTVGSQVIEKGQAISSYFSSATQSSSSLEIQGLTVETYYDDGDDISYAFAYASRRNLSAVYQDRATKLRGEIRQHVESGKRFEESGEKTKALEEYLACYSLFRQLEEAQAILTAVGSSMNEAFDELEKTVKKDELSISAVREAVQRLIQRPIGSSEDLAWYLARCLSEQLDAKSISVLVTPFSYQDSKMASQFSRYFKQVFESKVNEVAKWTPVQQVEVQQPKTRNVSQEVAQASGAQFVLRGTYWELPGRVKIIATIQRVSDLKTVGSAEVVLDSTILQKSGQSLKPENFLKALSDQKQFNKDEVIGGGLSLEVWTNKGSDDLIFTKGEKMQIYVRVNMPTHLRFLYHLADGRRTVLVDDYYIDESKVNQVYPIPEEFECDSPYGAEVLQAFARTEPFEPLETVTAEGYKFLKEDLDKFLSSTRGMKKAKPNTLQTETRVVITTMEK